MSWLDRVIGFKNWVGSTKFDRLSVEELRKERVRLEQIDRKLHDELSETESRKRELFERGRQSKNQREQVALARKIRELDAFAEGRNQQLAIVSKQARVLAGLVTVKENQSLIEELGMGSVLKKLDLTELQAAVEKASTKGAFEMEKFTQLLGAMESGAELAADPEDDSATMDIVAAMQGGLDNPSAISPFGEADPEASPGNKEPDNPADMFKSKQAEKD